MIIYNATIITMDPADTIINDGAVYINKGEISAVGKSSSILKKYNDNEKIDAGGMILMPGLINLHSHLYGTYACGMPISSSAPKDFPAMLKKIWWKLDKCLGNNAVRYSSLPPLITAIKTGTTALIDHHSSPAYVAGSLSVVADCFRETGIRGATCYEVSDRNGVQNADEGIEENIRFIKECKNSDGMIAALFGLHASFTLKDKTLAKAAAAGAELNTGFHIHLAEHSSDAEDSIKKYKISVVERLNKFRILGPRTLAAHCVYLTDKDVDIIAKTKTTAIHNPRSNMNNSVGRMKIEKFIERKAALALGSDGMSSGMWDELKTAFLLHKHDREDSRAGWAEPFAALFKTNPAIASQMFGRQLGIIAPGAAADLILAEYYPSTELTPDNLLGHIYFRIAEARIDTTIVNGKILMHKKELLHIDEKEIAAKAKEISKSVWKKL